MQEGEGTLDHRETSHVVLQSRPWPTFAAQGVASDIGTQVVNDFSSFPWRVCPCRLSSFPLGASAGWKSCSRELWGVPGTTLQPLSRPQICCAVAVNVFPPAESCLLFGPWEVQSPTRVRGAMGSSAGKLGRIFVFNLASASPTKKKAITSNYKC